MPRPGNTPAAGRPLQTFTQIEGDIEKPSRIVQPSREQPNDRTMTGVSSRAISRFKSTYFGEKCPVPERHHLKSYRGQYVASWEVFLPFAAGLGPGGSVSSVFRRELLVSVHPQYGNAGRREKAVILRGFCAAIGYHREYAIHLLSHPPDLKPRRRRGLPARYGPQGGRY
jgi:hypothetical protein